MEFQEWDLFKFNNKVFVVDKIVNDLIYSKKNPQNEHVECSKTSAVKIMKISDDIINCIYENLHPDFHEQLLDRILEK